MSCPNDARFELLENPLEAVADMVDLYGTPPALECQKFLNLYSLNPFGFPRMKFTWDGFNLRLRFTDPYEKYKRLDGQAMHYCRLAPNAAVKSSRSSDPATPSWLDP